MNKFLDILLPRFITEEMALRDDGDHLIIACSMRDVKPGERFDAVGTIRSFNLFGMALFPTTVGEPRPWPTSGYSDPRNGSEIWSACGESWSEIDSVEQLIRETDQDLIQLEAGTEVFVGVKAYPDPASFISADEVLQEMNENAGCSDHGEWVEDWPAPGQKAEQELGNLLDAWARQHCRPSFYLVENIRSYTITPADIERARTQSGSPAGQNLPPQEADQ